MTGLIRMSLGQSIDLVPAKTKDEEKIPVGTHQGRIKDPDVRARRAVKNLRNRSHRGEASKKRGSSKRPFQRTAPGHGVRSSGK